MNPISQKIRETIEAVKPALLVIAPETASRKASPEAWSKQEILGHLIDSACNNHQRFVRGAQNLARDFPMYKPVQWVEVQRYREMNWQELVELFYHYNLHLSRVIDNLSPEAMNNPCNIGKDNPVTIQFVVDDYLRHLRHHLEKILEKPI
ncbi:MAG: DinB family protein [Candidatus Omnitrophota bacterium]